MPLPVRIDRVAYRHVPWGGTGDDQDFVELGVLRTGGTAHMQIRYAPGNTATALVNLTTVSSGEGIQTIVDAGYLDPTTGAVAGATTWRPFIAQATLEAIPVNVDPTQPQVLAYDLIVTPSGGNAFKLAEGTFTLFPGVTF